MTKIKMLKFICVVSLFFTASLAGAVHDGNVKVSCHGTLDGDTDPNHIESIVGYVTDTDEFDAYQEQEAEGLD